MSRVIKLKKLTRKYNKIYYFPYNVQSRFLDYKINRTNSYFVDNYEPNSRKIIKPLKVEDKKNNLLIITDKNIEKYINIKFIYLKKIYFKISLSEKEVNNINLDDINLGNLTLTRLFQKYNTDKAKFYKRLIFKDKSHNYGPYYDKELKYLKKRKLNILEIGAWKGASTAAFHNFFPNSSIYAIDLNKRIFMYKSKRIMFFKLDYMNHNDVKKFSGRFHNHFDIIIDDRGHFKSHILTNIKNFFKCLKDDSFYIIEDFGLKFDYLNDAKKELSIFNIIKKIKLKKNFKSKILSKRNQNLIIKKTKKISLYTGDWIRSGKNVSDICFIKTY